MLRPLLIRPVRGPGGRVEYAGVAGLGATMSRGDAPGEVGPARIRRTASIKGMVKALHGGDRPPGMAWGPNVQYLEIPGGEWGTVATLKVMKELVLGKWGHRNPEVVLLAKKIVAGVSPGPTKDYEAMAAAILDFMKTHVKYELDPAGLEWVQTPHYTLLVSGSGDCFVKGTKVLLRDGHRLVPIESLRIGDEIWGHDRWSRVENTWERGVRATYMVRLNNGSVMRLTPEHKVWVARCGHDPSKRKRNPCSCPMSERKLERITVEELKSKDVLLAPEKVACGSGDLDPRRAFIEGLYVADGYKRGEERSSFEISGRDGFPREEQKREVQEICKSLGIDTHWAYNAISVKERDWADRVGAMGTLPWNKRLLSLDLAEPAMREALRGVLADSGRNTHGAGRTFTTSSRELHLQVRVLLKSLGISCSERFVSDHGSTSEHPVWRLGIRQSHALDSLGTIRDRAWREDEPKKCTDKTEKLLRVKEVVRDNAEAECFDIATDDHCVWLPEADWTTSQCDDHSTATAALAMALGFQAGFRTVKGDRDRKDQWSHVYPVIGVQTGRDTIWLTADSTQKESFIGWDPPEGKLYGMKTWVIDPSTAEDDSWR